MKRKIAILATLSLVTALYALDSSYTGIAGYDLTTFADGVTPTAEIWVDVGFDATTLDPDGAHSHLFYHGGAQPVYVGEGSETYPFRQIHQAVGYSDSQRGAAPGTRINVKAGLYSDRGTVYVWNASNSSYAAAIDYEVITFRTTGEEGAPVWLYSVDGPGEAVIDGVSDGFVNTVSIWIAGEIGGSNPNRRGYIIIDGFEVTNQITDPNGLIYHPDNTSGDGATPENPFGTQNIQILGGAHHIMIRNCHVHHSGRNRDVIKVSQCDNIYVENCLLHHAGERPEPGRWQESLDYVAVNNGHIVFCEVHNGMFYAKGGSRNITFYGNYSHDQVMYGLTLGGWTDAGYFYDPENDEFECYDSIAVNNVLANCGYWGFGFVGAQNCTAEFNTIINCGQIDDNLASTAVGTFPGQGPEDFPMVNENCTFRNNIVTSETGDIAYYMQNLLHAESEASRTDPAQMHISYNLWFSRGVTMTDADPLRNPDDFYICSGDAHSIYNADPLLDLSAPPAYHVPSGSPAYGAASNGESMGANPHLVGPQDGTVDPPADVSIDSFAASPTALVAGETATLSWTTSNASSCSIDQGIGVVDADGNTSVSPAVTTSYTLTAEGEGGPVTQTVEIVVTAVEDEEDAPPPADSSDDDGCNVAFNSSSGLIFLLLICLLLFISARSRSRSSNQPETAKR